MTPGIHDGLTIDTYRTAPGISRSGLAQYADCPARYRYGDPQQTRNMFLGTLIHCAILEPDQLHRRYQPSGLRTFNANHHAYRAEEAAAAGCELVKQADLDNARRIADAVHAHPTARAIIGAGLIVERSFAWHDPATGVLCRGRTDGIAPSLRAVLELKSCEDAGADAFAEACRKFRYHWQPPMYSDGLQHSDGWTPDAFLLVAVERHKPYLAATYELDPPSVQLGRAEIAHWLPAYSRSLQTDTWPGHPAGIQPLSLPARAFRRYA